MLLLVTLGLVVASAVLLILGFVQDALGFIYLSMLCAGVAALALFIFARLARRRGAALAGAGIAGGSPSPYLGAADRERTPATTSGDADPTSQVTVVGAGRSLAEPEPDDEFEEAPPPRVVVAPPMAPVGAAVPTPIAVAAESEDLDPWADDDRGYDWGDEVVFPIEDYDELRVAEILPLLGQLEPDELQEVRDRELAGKARATILDRIDDRLGRTSAGSTTASFPVVEAGAAPTTAAFSDPLADVAAGSPAGGARKTAARTTKAATGRKTAGATKKAAPSEPAKRAGGRKAAAATSAGAAPAAPTTPARRPAAKSAANSAGSPRNAAKAQAASRDAGPAAKATGRKAAAAKSSATTKTTGAAKKAGPAKKATATKRAAKKAE